MPLLKTLLRQMGASVHGNTLSCIKFYLMPEDLINDFKQILSPYVKEKALLENINLETQLGNDLHINSSNVVDIVLDAETKYEIIFEDEDFEKLHTVGGCIAVVEEKLAKK
jgi:acyl carrier protein